MLRNPAGRPARTGRHIIRLLAVLLLAIGSIGFGIATCATAAAPVRDFTVAGTRRTDIETVLGALTFKRGDTLTSAEIDRSIKRVFATGLFSDVNIRDDGGRVVVVVVENPRVARLAFEGNAALDTARLSAALALKTGAPYTTARAAADERTLRDLYRKEGRHTAVVTVAASQTSDGDVDVTFKIVEGSINKVRRIAFPGNRAFTDSQLRDVITTTESGWLDVLKTTVTYDKSRLDNDRLLLKDFYRRHGYPDASVSEARGEAREGSDYDVTFTIDEGHRYDFGAQRVESGVEALDRSKLGPLVAAKEGSVFDAGKVEATVTAIGQELAAMGEPFVRIVPRLKRDETRKTIAIDYVLSKGRAAYIGRIDIEGNARTNDAVIRRELRLAEGDPYNAVMVEGARKRVQRLGFFSAVAIGPARTDDDARVDLKVRVVELDTGILSFGIGYSETDGIIGDVGYSERNFLGTGRGVRVKLEAAQHRYGAELGFTEPHFLGTQASAGADFFYRDIDRTRQSSFKEQRWGVTTRIAMQMTDTVSASLNYSFSRSTLYDVGANASTAIKQAVPGFPNTATSTYDTSSIGFGVAYDTRDDRKSPTRGIHATFNQDIAGIGGDAQFVRSTSDVRGYVPVADGIVLAGRAGGGFIAGYAGQDVRLLDLFYRGSETVRGFASSGIGPRDNLSANQDAIGGKAYYVTSAEMRAKIAPSLTGVAFVDAGSLFGVSKSSAGLPGLTGNSAAPRVSAGVGLVWDSPIGGLQASYAFPLVSQPGDKVQRLGFGLTPGF